MLLFIANLFGQYLTKPSKDHHINLWSSVRDDKIGRLIFTSSRYTDYAQLNST